MREKAAINVKRDAARLLESIPFFFFHWLLLLGVTRFYRCKPPAMAAHTSQGPSNQTGGPWGPDLYKTTHSARLHMISISIFFNLAVTYFSTTHHAGAGIVAAAAAGLAGGAGRTTLAPGPDAPPLVLLLLLLAPTRSSCSDARTSSAKSDPGRLRRTPGLSNSARRPWAMTRMRSESRIVSRRCAMVSTVQSANSRRMVACWWLVGWVWIVVYGGNETWMVGPSS